MSLQELRDDSAPLLRDKDDSSYTLQAHRVSTVRTFVNVTKCFVGAASFELPYAVFQAGWVVALISIVILAVISRYTLIQLTQCGHLASKLSQSRAVENSAPTYPQVGFEAFGLLGSLISYFGIAAMSLGVVGAYFVFMGSTLSSLLIEYSCALTPKVMSALLLPLIVLLSWLRSYRFLAPASILGVLALLMSIIVVLVDGFRYNTIAPITTYPVASWDTFPLFLGNAAFLYLIHSVILPTEQSMLHRTQYPKAVDFSIVLVTVVNVVFALLAYFLYGENVQGNVIDNLHPGVLKIIVKVTLTIDLIGSSVLFLFPVFELFERAIWSPQQLVLFRVQILRNVLRTAIVGAACGVAVGVPFFHIITGLSGGFGNCILGLILPPLFYFRLQMKLKYWNKTPKKIAELCVCFTVLTIGVALFFISTIFTIESFVVGTNTTIANVTCGTA